MDGERTGATRWVFKNGKLLQFGPKAVQVLRQWPRCAAWLKPGDAPWQGTRPHDRCITSIARAASGGYVKSQLRSFLRLERDKRDGLLAPGREAELAAARERLVAGWTARHRAARTFIEPFPTSVLRLVLELPERQWHMVQLLAHCRGAMELASTNRGLAVAVASNWVFHSPAVQRPLRAARSLVRARRSVIAGWLGFPATRSSVSILAKLRAEAVTIERLLWLRGALRDPTPPKELQHLPVLTVPVLRILCDSELRRAASHSLLEELATGPDSGASKGAPYVLRDMLEARRLLGLGAGSAVRSLTELGAWHDEFVLQLNAKKWRESHAVVLPQPPVPGTDEVVPLTTSEALNDEGRTMHHCVATYAQRVAAGSTYIYRVLAPERATVSITRASTGPGWKINEISGVANRPVGHATLLAVGAWLRASGLGWGRLYGAPRSLDELYAGDDFPY